MKRMQKIVIKVGSSTLTGNTRRFMLGLAQEIRELKDRGIELLLVSSGATATGRECLVTKNKQPTKQAFSSIGQIKLMHAWSLLFSLLDMQVGQVLLSKEDFSSTNSPRTRDSLEALLEHVLPIINENDTLGSNIGDNDNLAALVACLVEADAVILLTDQEGLYTADPRHDPSATLIPVVKEIDEVFAFAQGSSTSYGTGGMRTKIEAAKRASSSGIRTIIAPSSRQNVLIDLIEGKPVGTVFLERGA